LAGWKVELEKPGGRLMFLAKVTLSRSQTQNGIPEKVEMERKLAGRFARIGQ